MSEPKIPLKIKFVPGSFDDFDGTQEELDELVAELKEFFNSEEFLEALQNAPLIDEDDDDLSEYFAEKLNGNHTIH